MVKRNVEDRRKGEDSGRGIAHDSPASGGLDNAENEQAGHPELRPSRADEGLSLENLSAAFAEMLGGGADPCAERRVAAERPGDDPLAALADPDADEASEISPRTILEAMLFVGSPTNKPLTARQVAGLMRGVRPAEIDQLVRALNVQYDEDGCPYEIAAEGEGYRLVLREKFGRVRDKFFGRSRLVKLSQAAIEVLAIVAYNQPATAEEVHKLRGTASGPILSQLVRRQLLRVERPDERPRIARYFTTDRFLATFGLASLEDLPQSQELDQL
jgi:segregation and condensation protein B